MGDLEFTGGRELAAISRQLRSFGDGKKLRSQFTKELRQAAKPAVPAVRTAIAAIPSKGRGSGLRKRLSRATRLRVRMSGRDAGVNIIVDGRKMPDGERALPAYMEGTKTPWRHPVRGTDRWVTQAPHPHFYRAVRGIAPGTRAAVNRVLDWVGREITRRSI